MAGKHWGSANYTSAGTHPPNYLRENRAYADGANGLAAPYDTVGAAAHALGAANGGEETGGTGYQLQGITPADSTTRFRRGTTPSFSNSGTACTVSFWIRFTGATPTNNNAYLFNVGDATTTADEVFSIQWQTAGNGSIFITQWADPAGAGRSMALTTTWSLGQWYYVYANYDSVDNAGAAALYERGNASAIDTAAVGSAATQLWGAVTSAGFNDRSTATDSFGWDNFTCADLWFDEEDRPVTDFVTADIQPKTLPAGAFISPLNAAAANSSPVDLRGTWPGTFTTENGPWT